MEMKKIAVAASLLVLLIVASFTGCVNGKNGKSPSQEKDAIPGDVQKTVKETVVTGDDDPATQDISQDMAEIESIEEDMNISDLEGLENDLDAIVW